MGAINRRLPIGAEAVDSGVHFRVWAPARERVEVALDSGRRLRLEREPNGYWSGLLDDAGAGVTYRYRLDAKDAYPIPPRAFSRTGRTARPKS